MRNLLSGGYEGTLRVVNPKEDDVQGIKAFHDAKELPPTDLAILVVAAIITPTTDMFTLFVVALPIYLLYEVSIQIVKITGLNK